MKCLKPDCGFLNQKDAIYCGGCGSDLRTEEVGKEKLEPKQTAYVEPQKPLYVKRKSNKSLYIICGVVSIIIVLAYYEEAINSKKPDLDVEVLIAEMEREASLQETILHPKEITIGMTQEQATDLLGYPNDKNRSVGSWGVHEQWVFEDNKYNHYRTIYLYFENGILTSYQE